MINKILLIVMLLIASISGNCQNVKTGIGTVNPQQALHVAGSSTTTAIGTTGVSLVTPTIEVNGLNSTNNTAHLAADGTSSLKRVYANTNGDLVLIKNTLELPVLAQEIGDVIPTVELIGTGATAGIQTILLKTKTFTISQPSVIYFSASVGALLRETVGGAAVTITDGRAKLYGTFFKFSAVPATSGVSTIVSFGNLRQTYANIATGSQGVFFLSPRAMLVLPAGTYTVDLYGSLYYDPTANPFRIQFGGGTTKENFLIHAMPTKYQ